LTGETGKETSAKAEDRFSPSIPAPPRAREKAAPPREGETLPPETLSSQGDRSIPAPVPPAGLPLAAKPPAPASGSKFVLNFDNADLYEVIRVMADMMKINFIIDPKVKGVVNIHTSGQLNTEEIFPLFQSILKLNGATAVQKGLIYEIVPLGDAKKLFAVPATSEETGKILPEERYTIQIIRLKYIAVTEVSKFIKPFLSDGADIIEHPPHNILIIGDLASNVRKSLGIIELFDLDIFSAMRVRIYPIRNSDVNEIAKEMERIFSSLEVNVKSGRGVGITFTPVQRINSLLVVSSIPEIFPNVERWLQELDRTPAEGTKVSVFVYYVQNGKAKDMADVLKQVYVSSKDKKLEFKEKITPASSAPGVRGARPPSPAPPPALLPSKEEAASSPEGGVPEGEINIVVDDTTNALIIRAYPRDYKAILETIKKLDLYPKQVLIEVLLAEITLDEATKYGLEFSTFTDSFADGGRSYAYTVGMGGIGTPASFVSGLRYSVTSAEKLTAAIHASATDNRLKVITSPHILASNNKEAKIQIGSSEPILTNTYTTPGATTTATTSVSSTGIVEGTIEYKDIGVILSVTPRISDAKLVTLDISIEQSSVSQKDLGNLKNVPFFPKKTAKTTLSVTEGQTIVIGGLIDDSKSDGSSGVPFLSKIPILGALFGYQSKTVGTKETILLMTPHVITDLHESNQVTQEFREKVQAIKKELEMKEKKGKKK
jgi:general secretion pathway protein D